MKKDEGSWSSIVWLAVLLYFGGFFTLKFFTWLGEGGFIWFLVGCFAVGSLYKGVMKWVDRELFGVLDTFHSGDGDSSEPLPFFVKGQVRRRKLDLTRSSNVVADSANTKRKRQTRGLLRLRKKKRR